MISTEANISPQQYLQSLSRWHPLEIAFWLATLLPFVLFPSYLSLASQIAITALFALSLDLILGYAGVVSLGHAAFFGLGLGKYRLFLIVVALLVTLVLVAGLEYTRFGAQVRAAVDNQRMARGLGINVDRTFASTFALGSGLAGLGGALAINIVGLDPNFSFTYLVYVLIIVSVGGLGSIAGSFAAACLIGVSDIAGKYYAPELGAFMIYLVMVLVLMWRPAGLFGKR